MIQIKLKRGKEDSLGRFHPWVFSGAIHSSQGGQPEEGDLVDVIDSEGRFIARGHCSIGSIAVRVLTFEDQEIDQAWWTGRISQAYAMREAIGLTDNERTNCYRLIHGEGDGLSGLIVDVYGSTAVIQAHTVGMYLSRESIVAGLREVLGERLTAIYDKSSGTLPPKCDIQTKDGYLYGNNAGECVVENAHRFYANWEDGQKTGFFLDQRANRDLVGRYSVGKRVLNTFCYTGGFSVYALAAGAARVVSVDSSSKAMALTDRNIELNFGTNESRHESVTRDALDYIRDMPGGEYDVIILDPPAFAKHHRVLGNALQGYKRLNARAMEKIAPGGILFTFSCSQAVSREQFRMAVFSAAAIAGRRVRILHQLSQPADHPVNIYHPEGEYLKGLVLYVE